MILSDRQKDILHKVVFEYIDQAQPISSKWLEGRYDLEISPATIRNELLFLTEEGFLLQQHTSAGRVPSDKGYRFFVDELSKHDHELEEDVFVEYEKRVSDYVRSIQMMTKGMAEASSSLIVTYIPSRDLLWKEGWESVLKEPEFEENEQIWNFTNFLADLEKSIQKFHPRKMLDIYIGKENPFSSEQDFSVLFSVYPFSRTDQGMVAMVGPKRMAYDRNIGLLNYLHKVLN